MLHDAPHAPQLAESLSKFILHSSSELSPHVAKPCSHTHEPPPRVDWSTAHSICPVQLLSDVPHTWLLSHSSPNPSLSVSSCGPVVVCATSLQRSNVSIQPSLSSSASHASPMSSRSLSDWASNVPSLSVSSSKGLDTLGQLSNIAPVGISEAATASPGASHITSPSASFPGDIAHGSHTSPNASPSL